MALILLSAVFYGWTKIYAERNKLKETSAFYDFIRYIRDNIEHFSKPLPEICKNYQNQYFTKRGLSSQIERCGIKSALEAYVFLMSEEDTDTVLQFAREIGGGYREDELRLCDYTLKRLEGSIAAQKGEIKNKEKMYKTIPVLLAASVILLFV